MNIVLFDSKKIWQQLLPLTYTRPVSEIRIGILTIREKWEKHFNSNVSYITEKYLSEKYPLLSSSKQNNLYIASHIIPDTKLVAILKKLKPGTGIKTKGLLIAYNCGKTEFKINKALENSVELTSPVFSINQVWDVFSKNAAAIQLDFELICKGRKSALLSKTNTIIGKRNLLFIEKGAKIEAAVLNTTNGPIYIGKNAEIMEGSLIRGPFAICEDSALKLATKVYGPTTIGPHCKVGGEINNSVIFGYSNKAHDGFLGNSVIGEWCNLGADTNNSNLKNNYGSVKLYNYRTSNFEDTGLQFCGLIMGDHSKTGINTMLNTGTVVGVAANIFGGGFPPTHIPSFTWGGSEKLETYRFDKMFETAVKVYTRRQMELNAANIKILEHIFRETGIYRD